MKGITGWGAHIPYRRLDRAEIAPVAGTGGGRGHRSVASYDEDVTTMAVEASRRALRTTAAADIGSLWYSTVEPPYLDKSNSSIVHAALGLGRGVASYDVHGSTRSALAALRAGLALPGTSLVVASDIRTGRPGSSDETAGGDAASALIVGDDPLAEIHAWGSTTDELHDRWRSPGAEYSSQWEERFAVPIYSDLAVEAWNAAGIGDRDVDHVIVTGLHDRAVSAVAKRREVGDRLVPDLSDSVGNSGAAHPFLLLSSVLDSAPADRWIAVVALGGGADVFLVRTTDLIDERVGIEGVADQVARGGGISYGKFLAWRGFLGVEPPNRPEPARPSSSAAHRNSSWKYGLVGSSDVEGRVHLPPSPDDEHDRPMADAVGTVVTFTVDRLAYSPSPPVVFAVVDFDGGGRLPIELTDVDPDDVEIGSRVEMTFRRIFTGDGIHNYFWKARLRR